jgi:hypothetical protein
MKTRLLLLSVPALLFGCAHAPTISNEQVAQLPTDARQQIVQALQAVTVADQNVGAARVAVNEAQKFDHIAKRELDSARAESDAAQAGVSLGQSAHSQRVMQEAQARQNSALTVLFAARSKKLYADRLVDLRKAELNERQAELNLAQAHYELVKYQQLQAHDMAGGMDGNAFMQRRQDAENDVANARRTVANLEGNVASLRTAWLQRAQQAQTASRGAPIMAPTPPRPLELPPVQDNPPTVNPPPAGGVNEGPSAPQSIPQP